MPSLLETVAAGQRAVVVKNIAAFQSRYGNAITILGVYTDKFSDGGEEVKLIVAGRTDAGVHASGQVVSFEAQTKLAPSLISYRTTAVLPEDVAFRRCVPAGENFVF